LIISYELTEGLATAKKSFIPMLSYNYILSNFWETVFIIQKTLGTILVLQSLLIKVAPNSFHRCRVTYYISSEF